MAKDEEVQNIIKKTYYNIYLSILSTFRPFLLL